MRVWRCHRSQVVSTVFSASAHVLPATTMARRSLQWQHASCRPYLAGLQMPISAAFNCTRCPPPSAVSSVAKPSNVLSTALNRPSLVTINGLLIESNHIHGSCLHSLSGQPAESQPGIKGTIPKPSLNTKDRITGYLRESLLLSYTAFFDNVIFRSFELLRLDRILKWLTPHLEDGYAKITGNWYQLADGTRRSLSLVNHTAFDFSVPHQYKVAEFPFKSTAESSTPAHHGSVHQSAKPGTFSHASAPAAKSTVATHFDSASLYRAHFLSLCMKMVYEKQEVIDDIASQSFGCQLQGYFLTSDKQTKKKRHESSTGVASKRSKAGFVPRTLAMVLKLPKAKVVAFRGTEPTNLINMRSSGSISMTHPDGMGGVHDGFWTALMYESEEAGGANLFDRLVEALHEGDRQQDIYLTGHSLGGALAAVFAQALCARGHQKLAKRIKGVHTFGGPRIGDAQFCRMLSDNYPGLNFRYVHGADIIPKIPPMFLLYSHFPTEIFLSSFGHLVLDSVLIRRWHKIESYGYLPIQLLKTVGNLVRLREFPVRTVSRLALYLSVPGLSDHFPQDYERLLRDHVTVMDNHQTPKVQKWSKFSRVEQIVIGL